jgi:uncharacterized iron-regulated membrane protein
MRKAIFWLHLSAGVVAGVVVLVMSVTGALLAFEKDITAWAERPARILAEPPNGAARLPVEQIVARAGQVRDAPPASIMLLADPAAAAVVSFGREGVVYVNPYTGEITGEGSRRVRGFFQAVTDWHRWLGTRDAARPFGRGVTGACNLAFLVLIVTGPILWVPRIWSWRHLRPVFFFQGRLTDRARDFNWHNVIGVWSAVPLFVIVLGAVVISYPWANDLLYRVVGEQPPAGRAGGSPEARRAPSAPGLAGIDPLWARAETQVEGWKSITLRLPAPDAPVTFTIDRADAGRPQWRTQLTLARGTGAVVRAEPFDSLSRGRRLRMWMRFLHTGEAAGLPGKTVAFVASAGATVLVWTGLALAWRRLRGWAGRLPARTPDQRVSRYLEETT